MKIISKQVITIVIDDNGDFEDTIKKTVSIIDESFDSLSIDDIHDIIATSLRRHIKAKNCVVTLSDEQRKILQQHIDKQTASR